MNWLRRPSWARIPPKWRGPLRNSTKPGWRSRKTSGSPGSLRLPALSAGGPPRNSSRPLIESAPVVSASRLRLRGIRSKIFTRLTPSSAWSFCRRRRYPGDLTDAGLRVDPASSKDPVADGPLTFRPVRRLVAARARQGVVRFMPRDGYGYVARRYSKPAAPVSWHLAGLPDGLVAKAPRPGAGSGTTAFTGKSCWLRIDQ